MSKDKGRSIEEAQALVFKIDKLSQSKEKTIKDVCRDLGIHNANFYAMRNRLKAAGKAIPKLQHPEIVEAARRAGLSSKKKQARRKGLTSPIAAARAHVLANASDDGLESYDKPELIRTIRRERIESAQDQMVKGQKMSGLLKMVGSN